MIKSSSNKFYSKLKFITNLTIFCDEWVYFIMKLEKLRILREELQEEMVEDEVIPAIFYQFDNKWIELDIPTALSKGIQFNLERCQGEPIAHRPRNSNTAWYSCATLGCVISLTFQSSPQKRTLEVHKRRVGNVVKRAVNSYKVSHNQLTQLLARDSFREKLEAAVLLASDFSAVTEATQEVEQDRILAVLALDIDHFKQVNDTYGHLYGDQVLKAFAMRLENVAQRIMKDSESAIEISLGHPSGEEFLISVHGSATKESVMAWANAFRTRISEEPLPSDSEWSVLSERENLSPVFFPQLHERSISASVGVAFYNPIFGNEKNKVSVTSILDAADTALYRAKSAGRNQVINFDDILSNCGRVLEHDLNSRIVAIDIGKNVGVLLGQEFRVFAPGYTGARKFSINDGRTVRTIGNYPRIELTTVTVFDVQPELAFAYIAENSATTVVIEEGAALEAIPTGSIGHLLTGASRYFPKAMEHVKVGDSSALQDFIKNHANADSKPFSIVFRFVGEQDYLKKYGSAALNAALAQLFKETSSVYHSASAIGVLDTGAICVVGRGAIYDEEALVSFSYELAKRLPELRLTVGVFCQNDQEDLGNKKFGSLDYINAIEFARYAASNYAVDPHKIVVHFGVKASENILSSLRESRMYAQALTDFRKLRNLGVSGARFFNIGGLVSQLSGESREAAEVFEIAMGQDPKNLVIKSNFGIAAYAISEFDRGLKVLNAISDLDLEKLRTSHPFGYLNYASLLAQAKIQGLASFDLQRFSLVASKALALKDIKSSARNELIKSAMNY